MLQRIVFCGENTPPTPAGVRRVGCDCSVGVKGTHRRGASFSYLNNIGRNLIDCLVVCGYFSLNLTLFVFQLFLCLLSVFQLYLIVFCHLG